MKKRLNSVVSLLLSVLMLCGGIFVPLSYAAEEDGADAAYEIYPTPHEISYQGSEINLPETLPAIWDAPIDQYTKTRAEEALAQAGVTLGGDADAGMCLRVGVYGSNGTVDQYFSTKGWTDSNLFAKTDAYQLVISEDGVSVLGKNTDAAFYGLTTLKRILQQVSDRTVRTLTVKDYSDVALRGFIEGYYGNPWSNEDRAELMKFGGELKMNIYFYAPKDDPKHNAKWRELYTEEELQKIRMLAQAGEESKCRYGYALHTFMNNPVRFNTEENYQEDLAIAKAKFTQVLNNGVRQIAVLADDVFSVTPPTAAQSVKFMTDLTNWVSSDEMQRTYPGLQKSIPFCPGAYGSDGNNTELKGLSKAPAEGGLPDSVPIIMTGGAVWGHVEMGFLNTFKSNTGRTPFMWVNWPCSDNGKHLLVMGGFDTVLTPQVNPSSIQGIMLNPMQQSEPSKVAIFGNADYAWNIWQDKAAADKAWYDSFKYVDHMSNQETETSAALREMSKHMIYENGYNPFPESVELKPKLDAFKDKLNSDTFAVEDIEKLKAEFQKLSDAADLYLKSGHTRLADQIQYWLHSWQDVTAANLTLLDALKEIKTGDGGNESNSRILSLYSDAQARYEKSKTYGFHYVDHTEYAMVGSQVIQPFTQLLLSKVAETAQQIVDPTIFTQTPITSRSDTPEGGLNAMLDGDPKTEAIFKDPNHIAEGEYVGVRFNRATTLTEVHFLMGHDENLNDTFTDCKLQYTPDGANWIDIQAFTGTLAVLEKTGLNLTVKGVRAIATAAKDITWLGVREIYINEQPGPEEPEKPEENNRLTGTPFKSDDVHNYEDSLKNMLDGNAGTVAMLAREPYNEDNDERDHFPKGGYVGIDLGSQQAIGHITIQGDKSKPGDKMTNAVLEYSSDGTEYTAIKSDINDDVDLDVSISARYIRLRNGPATNVWARISEFIVEKPSADTPFTLTPFKSDDISLRSNLPFSNLVDGNEATEIHLAREPYTEDLKDKLPANSFVGVDLGRKVLLGKISIVQDKTSPGKADYMKDAILEYSLDGTTYTTIQSGLNSNNISADLSGQDISARYVRLRNGSSDANGWVRMAEFTVQQYDPKNPPQIDHLYKSEEAEITGATGELTTGVATLSAESVKLEPNGYVGIKLPRIRELTEITADFENDALVLEAGCSRAEMEPVKLPLEGSLKARYIQLHNTGNEAVTFALTKLRVRSDEVSQPHFLESNIGGETNPDDARQQGTTGNLFDGNVTTFCKFCASQTNGQYVTYDLGQTRSVSSLDLIVGSDEWDYVRNGKVQISMDNKNWTDVITITSDVAQAGADVPAGQVSGWVASGEPNFLKQSGTIEPQDARYVRVVFTNNFSDRWLVINEIVVNGGEYIPESNPMFTADPPEGNASAVPSNLIDGDITTGFTPNMTGRTEGSLVYRLSEMTRIGQINILQSSGAISDALVEVRTDNEKWIELGKLSQTFNSLYVPSDQQNVFEIRLTWKDVTPTFYELLTFEKGAFPVDTSKLERLIEKIENMPPIDETDEKYDPDLLKAYKDKLAAAQKMLKESTEGLTQYDVNKMYNELTEAFTALTQALDEAKAMLKGQLRDLAEDEKMYTPSSWQAYRDSDAYQQAQDALKGENLQAVKDAIAAITAQAEKLELRADWTQVTALLEQIDALQQSDYTAESFAAFQTEVTRIRAAMTDENLVQVDADKLLGELIAAKEKLVRKPSGGHSSSGSSTTTTTTTETDGIKVTTTVNKTTGETTVTTTSPDGVKAQTVTDKNGKTNITATIPPNAIKETDTIALPTPSVDPEKGVQVEIMLPKTKDGITVSIPLENASAGTVAVLVGKDGSETIKMDAVVSDGKLLVPLDGTATIKIKDNGKSFVDVPAGNWAAEAVQFAASRELFQGTGAGHFSPQEPMSRAMFATVLYRLAGTPAVAGAPSFTDVAQGKYYADAVAWANQQDIVKGTGGQYVPDAAITREQLAVILFRYAQGAHGNAQAAAGKILVFADAGNVSPWAGDAVAWAVENGILTGSSDKKLHPGDNAARAEVAAMLQRFIMIYTT